MTELRPAPRQLALLAAEMRDDWDYEDTRQALIACSLAGWDSERIYRAVFRLLLQPDSSPASLRQEARDPTKADRPLRVVAEPGEEAAATAYTRSKADEVRAMLASRDHQPPSDGVA